MKKTKLILAVMLMASVAMGDIDTLKGEYAVAKKKIDSSEAILKQNALKAYSKALDSYMSKYKRSGDLDNYTLLKTEKDRLVESKTVLPSKDITNSDIQDASMAYEQSMAQVKADAEKAHLGLLQRYKPALERLIRKYMQADKMAEAKVVKDELDRVKFIIADIDAKQPKKVVKKKVVIKKAELSFSDLTQKDIVGRYHWYVNSKKVGIVTVRSNGSMSNYFGKNHKAYKWKLDNDGLYLTWKDGATVFNKIAKKGTYNGYKEDRLIKMVKISGR